MPTFGPLVKFNAVASAAHRHYHDTTDALKAEGAKLLKESERLMQQKIAVIALLELAHHEQIKAIYTAHQEIPEDAAISVDCDADGYRIVLSQTDGRAKAPAWAEELAREMEGQA